MRCREGRRWGTAYPGISHTSIKQFVLMHLALYLNFPPGLWLRQPHAPRPTFQFQLRFRHLRLPPRPLPRRRPQPLPPTHLLRSRVLQCRFVFHRPPGPVHRCVRPGGRWCCEVGHRGQWRARAGRGLQPPSGHSIQLPDCHNQPSSWHAASAACAPAITR